MADVDTPVDCEYLQTNGIVLGIPTCVVCSDILSDDLYVIGCGHVYHKEWYDAYDCVLVLKGSSSMEINAPGIERKSKEKN